MERAFPFPDQFGIPIPTANNSRSQASSIRKRGLVERLANHFPQWTYSRIDVVQAIPRLYLVRIFARGSCCPSLVVKGTPGAHYVLPVVYPYMNGGSENG